MITLKAIRKEIIKCTQNELGKKLGCSKQFVSRMEKQNKAPLEIAIKYSSLAKKPLCEFHYKSEV